MCAYHKIYRDEFENVHKVLTFITIVEIPIDVFVTYPVWDVTIEGESVKLGDYTVILKKSLVNNDSIVFRFEEAEVPENYLSDTSYHCEHCHTNRRRNTVYILKAADGSFIQVGSTCLKDYTGHSIYVLTATEKLIREFTEDWDKGEHYQWGLDLVEYLVFVAWATEKFGYVSRRNAEIDRTTPTSEIARDAMCAKSCPLSREDWERLTPHVKTVVEWFRTNAETLRVKNEFWNNLVVLALGDDFNPKYMGFVAYMLEAYRRELEDEANKKAEAAKPVSQYVGVVKEKVETTVKVKFCTSFDSCYGTIFIVVMEDANGNVFVWKSADPHMEMTHVDRIGMYWFRIRATVKAHEEYKGVAQTIVTRVKLLETLN